MRTPTVGFWSSRSRFRSRSIIATGCLAHSRAPYSPTGCRAKSSTSGDAGSKAAPGFAAWISGGESIAGEVERLEASPLARRIIDLPRLKRLVDEWPADEHAAIARRDDYRIVLARGIHFGRFIRWVEGGNA